MLCTIATAVIGAEFMVIQNNSTQADSLAYLSALYCTVFACIVLLGSTLYFVYARNIEETYDDYEKGRKEREELERSKLKAELEHTQLENEKLRADLEREKLRAELEHMQLENEKLKADLEQTKLENALLTAQLSKSNNID